MTITSTISTRPTDEQVATFMCNFGGYPKHVALEYLKFANDEARAMAYRIRDSILADRTITNEYKEQVKI